MSLLDRVMSPDADIDEIAKWLDGLDPATRIIESRSLGPKAQRRLWGMARGRAVSLLDLVPAERGPLDPVRHYGRNTLPVFKHFEKRFCRPTIAGAEGVLWGYTEGSTRAIAPGYFVCRETPKDSRGAVVVDYYLLPPEKPASWPKIVPNDVGPSRLIYGFMHDFLRKISAHVTIGRAYRRDRETPNCFTLCREA